MAKVTDKQYYLDGYLKSNLDFCVTRIKRNWDSLLIVEGEEGSGKSTLAKGMGYYVAWCLNRTFTADNIFFDIEKMSSFARENTRQVIIWDEAALGGMAADWQNNTQQQLIKTLITCRKKEHFFIFVIPEFKLLKRYLALNRSLGLIQVYSPDRLNRGYYKLFGKNKKAKYYQLLCGDKAWQMRKFLPSCFGRFSNTVGLIDEEAYERNKDEAISMISVEKESKQGMVHQRYLLKLLEELKKKGITKKAVAGMIGIRDTSLTRSLQGAIRDRDSEKISHAFTQLEERSPILVKNNE